MSVIIPDDIQGLAEANAELDRLMAEDEKAEAGSQKLEVKGQQDQNPESATAGQRAAQGNEDDQGATTEAADQGTKKDQGTAEGKKQDEATPQKSRYDKARERQQKSWDELNAQKEAFKREREEFDRVKTDHEKQLSQAEEQFSPDQYEDAAEKFEKAGKFDLAELAREKAKALRAGPRDQGTKGLKDQAQAKDTAARKEWALKAGVDFPELSKTNSSLQVRVAQLMKEEPEFKTHPKGIYLAARIASLETQSAGVADKDKELSKLRAKVKELEGLTAPGGPGSPTQLPANRRFEDKTDTEQYEELQELARQTGALH